MRTEAQLERHRNYMREYYHTKPGYKKSRQQYNQRTKLQRMARVSEEAKARFREYSRAYSQTEAGKATRQRYVESEHGRKALLQRARLAHLKKKYGLTLETREALFEQQGRCCAACQTTDPGGKKGWHVDHDHNIKTPHARAILCNPCNVALGHAKESIPRLKSLISYLEKYAAR